VLVEIRIKRLDTTAATRLGWRVRRVTRPATAHARLAGAGKGCAIQLVPPVIGQWKGTDATTLTTAIWAGLPTTIADAVRVAST
jgi:hypothetical protein